jgi:hypothetical protein
MNDKASDGLERGAHDLKDREMCFVLLKRCGGNAFASRSASIIESLCSTCPTCCHAAFNGLFRLNHKRTSCSSSRQHLAQAAGHRHRLLSVQALGIDREQPSLGVRLVDGDRRFTVK